jgi:uncharacterized protein YodC (DUF2158 family)
MSEEAFKVGDVVQLKSGGPRMTVTNYGPSAMGGEMLVWCDWFDGTKKLDSSFAVGAVKLVNRSQ